MFCHICLDILQKRQVSLEPAKGRSGDTVYYCWQHESAESFENSADRQCQICLALWERSEQNKALGVASGAPDGHKAFTGTRIKFSGDSIWHPSRLIHIGSTTMDMIQLPITTNEEDPSGPYMTLSHCRGSRQPLMLLQETKTILLQGIELHQLPRTFQDAVTVTQQFGISYLWIDSLCIQQNSQLDWEAESLLTDKVYTKPYLNISVNWGSKSYTGLFHQRDPLVDSLALLDLHAKFFELIPRREYSSSSTESSPDLSLPSLFPRWHWLGLPAPSQSRSARVSLDQENRQYQLFNPEY